MGLFSAVGNNWNKAQAAAVVQGFLEHLAKQGLLDGSPTAAANRLVAQAWATRPSIFEGKEGPKPHKASVAAFSLAAGLLLERERGNESLCNTFALALGLLMQELGKNEHMYPFHHVDHFLLERAGGALEAEVDALEGSPLMATLGL